MNLVTGSDMTKEMITFESQAKKLPANYQAAWEKQTQAFLPKTTPPST
nr:hypothetical protein [Paenibacillus oceani]